MPDSIAVVQQMGWDDMQALFAATYLEEVAAVRRSGGKALVRERLAALPDGVCRVLREALADPEFV